MASLQETQQHFLQQIKDKLPPNLSFVEELADVLNISTDSSYRRIRGETALSLDEIKKISIKYNLSLDTFFGSSGDTVTFDYRCIDHDKFTFNNYLTSILENLKLINSFDQKELIYAAKDIPLFHFFEVEGLAEFKIFFWLKSILQYPELEKKRFKFGELDPSMLETGRKITDEYIKIPSVEIWSSETLTSTLKQIEYYWESGLFHNKEEVLSLISMVEDMMIHIKIQAEQGHKFHKDHHASSTENNYKLYSHEVTIPDNTILFSMGDTKVSFLVHNVLNILTTSNTQFCDQTYATMNNIIQK